MNAERRKQLEALSTRLEAIRNELQIVGEDEREYFDIMPAGLQSSPRGLQAEEHATEIDDIQNELDELRGRVDAIVRE